MIDKLHLFTRDFLFSGDFSSYDKVTQFVDKSKAKTESRMYGFFREPKYGSVIKVSVKHQLNIELNPERLCPSKIIGTGFQLPDIELTKEYLDKTLAKIGIKSNLNMAKVKRLDVYNDFKTKYPVDYLIGGITPIGHYNHMQQVTSPEQNGYPYLRFQNSRTQLVFYDKGQELMNRGITPPQGNYLRIESRLMNTKACSLSDIHIFGDVKEKGKLIEIWEKPVQQLLVDAKSRGFISKPKIIFTNIMSKIEATIMADNVNINKLIEYHAYLYLEKITNAFGGIKGFEEAVGRLSVSCNKWHRRRRFIDKVYRVYNEFIQDSNTRTYKINVWEELSKWASSSIKNI